ncbi:MAG: division/cell wall cluster transcriptional repressor MraZ [Tissierellia bacterium]|nr:division/cell wall cluster transcriptional repressor MraZ [Tissierellia bacterium]
MFLGEYNHKLDSKNRLMLPSDFRKELSGSFYVTKGAENTLIIYTCEQFQKKAQSLDNLTNNNKKNRALKRLFFSSTTEVSLDKQGRFLINKNLLDYANIKKDVMIIGNGNNIEIWDVDNWNKYIKDVEIKLSDIMDE